MNRSLPPGIAPRAARPIPEAGLMTVYQPHPQRGSNLLLVHCAVRDDDRPSAYTRLEHKVGGELARLLVYALAPTQGRRASSSP